MNDETPNAQQSETERSLRENERRLATLFSNLPGMAYRCKNDRDWTMTFVSGGCEALTGYKPTDLVGSGALPYNLLIHPDDRDRIWTEVQEALTQRLPFKLTYRIHTADNQDKWVWEQGVGVYSGVELKALEGFITDITELKEAERKYRDIFEGAFEGMYRTTAQGKSLAANPAMARMLGYDSAHEFVASVNDTTRQLWVDPARRSQLTQLLEGHEFVRGFECQFKRKDGTQLWVSLNIRKVRGPDEQTVYYEGFIDDITGRKCAEATIQHANAVIAEAERHYRLMFNSVSDAVFVHKFGEDGLPSPFFEVNDNACRLLGYTREELLQMRVVDIIATEEQFNAPANAKRLLADGHRNWEGLLSLKDGRRIPVEVNARVFDLDGSPTIISSMRDISERKEAEEQYRNIFDGAMEGIYRTAPAGKLLAANSALAKMLGYDSREQLESTINDMAHQVWLDPNDRKRFIALLEEQGSLRNFECQVKRKDGAGIWVSVKGRKVCGADGRTLYYDGFVDDITERKHTEAEKAKLEDQLRQAQKLESIGKLAGGVAHDFNNLLTVINGYSDFLLERLATSEPLRSQAGEIRTAAERAAGLTKQLLAFSRRQTIEPRVVDLNTTIRESAPMLQRLIGEDIALKTHLDSSSGQIMADPDQIHQVLMNFAVNARDAMALGGTLDIETTDVELNETISATIHHDVNPGFYVLMTVTDTGHGMDETTRQHIFEPFFTTKEIGKGTGLGLATVYGIVQQSGGWIEVQSKVGVGTSFKVYLPRIDASQVREEHVVSTVTEKASETILLVEDQEAVRSFGVAALKRYGYYVIETADGEEAIAAAGKYSGELHLLLTDVVLPGMNGKELAERLKELRPNLKVLFFSGYTADVIAHHGVLNPGVAFLHKPFSQEELAQKVREVLENL